MDKKWRGASRINWRRWKKGVGELLKEKDKLKVEDGSKLEAPKAALKGLRAGRNKIG